MGIEVLRDMSRAGVSAFVAGGGSAPSTFVSTLSLQQYVTTAPFVAVPGVTASTRVRCYLAPNADYDADDLEGFNVIADPRAGLIAFVITGPGWFVGTFDIVYTIEA